jgi:hypothetical protein
VQSLQQVGGPAVQHAAGKQAKEVVGWLYGR